MRLRTDILGTLWHDFLSAVGLLTRLPIPVDAKRATARRGHSAWAYPLVGLLVGGLAGAAGQFALGAGVTPSVAAVVVLGVAVAVTGALHEDGLADTADGFWGGWSRERRLEIMRDSRIGTFGVLALVLCTLGRWAALVALIDTGTQMIAVAAATSGISRVPMVILMGWLPMARNDGLAVSTGATDPATGVAATVLGSIFFMMCIGTPPFLGAALVCIFCGIGVGWIALRKIGGQTGDVLGASQQICEFALLAYLAAYFTA
ncbi:MAG: adenosylcobinamide-GDP ribazoletransferase [Pseudomonadota bacterium]